MQQAAEKLETRTTAEARYKKVKDVICKNIKDSMKYIEKLMPSLHCHLKESLRTVNRYCPKQETAWHTRYTDKTIRAQIGGRKVLFEEF